MRIGLYGMPTSGKTHILDRIDFIEVLVGSKLLREYDPDFDKQPEYIREQDRKAVANIMLSKKDFIMDGHYAFGDTIAFTEEEGNMYDIYLYLYIEPAVLKERINNSPKNQKYAQYDVEKWQRREIDGLREYCHKHNKDFYVVDNPTTNTFEDVSQVIEFIRAIKDGYSVQIKLSNTHLSVLSIFWTAIKPLPLKIQATRFLAIRHIYMTGIFTQVIRRGSNARNLMIIYALT